MLCRNRKNVKDKCPAQPVLDPVPAVILKAHASGPKSLPRAKPRGTRAHHFDLTRAGPPPFLPAVTRPSRSFFA
jgi:hypothetical protein